jgi:hypothetical protein
MARKDSSPNQRIDNKKIDGNKSMQEQDKTKLTP